MEGVEPPQASRFAGRFAVAVWITGAIMLIAAFALQWVTRSAPVDAFGFRGADGILGLPAATIGALIIRRRPRNPIGWLWLATGFLGGGLTALTAEYAVYSYVEHGGTLPLTAFSVWLQQSLWIPAMGAIFVVAHLFPTGRLVSRRWRGAVALTIAGVVVFAIPFSLYPGEVGGAPEAVMNPYAIPESVAEPMLSIGSILFLAGIAAAVASLIVRYRRARGGEREQIRWLIPALALVLIAMAANVVSALTSSEGVLPSRIIPLATMFSICLLILAAGAAILRYRLYDIEIILNRAVVVGVVVSFITVVYVSFVAGIGALVGSRTGSGVALPIVATAVVGVAFQPVRLRAGRLADTLVYGKRATPVEALAGFAESASVDDLGGRVARLVVEATALRSATFWLRTGGELRSIASWPSALGRRDPVIVGEDLPEIPDATAVYPLEHQGELMGMLAVAVAANETVLRDDDRLVRALAAQASHVLRTLLDAVDLPTGVVTFMMTDIEGSTRLWEDAPAEMADALSAHDRLVRDRVAGHGGVLVKSRGEGDSTFSVFADPANALAAAISIQSDIAARSWPTTRPIRVRASLHTGAAQLRDRDYYGPVINRCARLRAIACGGQTLVSGATYELGRGSLPSGVTLVDLGTHTLKDLVDAERVFQLTDPRLPSDFPPLRTPAR
ncbi:MAG TPA: adenylate/guanylate cyclase domain-containing protein [Actinomycetota bacterium]